MKYMIDCRSEKGIENVTVWLWSMLENEYCTCMAEDVVYPNICISCKQFIDKTEHEIVLTSTSIEILSK